MPKFFVEEGPGEPGAVIRVTGETAHHIVNVLRHRRGDRVMFCDGRLNDFCAALLCVEKQKNGAAAAVFEILETKKCGYEPPAFVRLCQSLIKWDCFEYAVTKAVECGASEIAPVLAARGGVSADDAAKRLERLRRLARQAAEQSMRGIIPKILPPAGIAESIADTAAGFFGCHAESRGFAQALSRAGPAAAGGGFRIWIGPEGGFTADEKELLKSGGALPVRLGNSVLRSETAAVAAISQLLCCLEGAQ